MAFRSPSSSSFSLLSSAPFFLVLSLLLASINGNPPSGSVMYSVTTDLPFGYGQPLELQISDSNVPTITPTFPLAVYVDIVHTYSEDVVLTLTSPAGTTVILTNGQGGCNDLYSGLTFDSNSANPLDIQVCYNKLKDARPKESLTAFEGEDPNGVWKLHVDDKFILYDGSFYTWGLLFGADLFSSCTPSPCQNLGVCTTNTDSDYQCNCPTGYYGKNCEIGPVTIAIDTTEPTASSISIQITGSLGQKTFVLGAVFGSTGISTFPNLDLTTDLGVLQTVKVMNSNPTDPWTFSTLSIAGGYNIVFGENIRVKSSRILDAPLTLSFTVKTTSPSLSAIFFGFQGSKLSASRKIPGPFAAGQTVTRTFPFVNIHDIRTVVVRSYSIDDIDFDQIQVTFKGVTKTFVNTSGQSVNKYRPLSFSWSLPI